MDILFDIYYGGVHYFGQLVPKGSYVKVMLALPIGKPFNAHHARGALLSLITEFNCHSHGILLKNEDVDILIRGRQAEVICDVAAAPQSNIRWEALLEEISRALQQQVTRPAA